jgi:hypothetical protein
MKSTRIIGRLGDVDPIEYGGGVVFTDGSHRWIEYTYGQEGEDFEGRTLTHVLPVYRVDIPDDVFMDLEWVDINGVASSIGVAVHELDKAGSSDKVGDRAWAVEAIAGYYGWTELDSYPMQHSLGVIEANWRL